MNLRIRLATENEAKECNRILHSGRMFQREQGFVQWRDEYPNLATVQEDIQRERGYVLMADDCIAGYLCIDFDGEPAYEKLKGRWNTKGAYGVVHRMAIDESFRNRGLAHEAFRLVEQHCLSHGVKNVRIDTDFPNKRMQHILEKNGYQYCGDVMYGTSGRMAYDKKLE